ncbi:DUF1553 domain-containing protein [Planctomicrobium sp. SH661]|uniref:DUF1553 domain-containing protein n=1 Tax=Planctomicrobium sp. SH661 TaxID=3448124 RepID=UPI003F5AECE9
MAVLPFLLVTAATASEIDYENDIRSLLKQRCWSCHGSLKQESELRLDTVSLMRKGGGSGPAIEPGKPEQSLLIERISSSDPATRMPPEGAMLTSEQIAKITAWIAEGATAPEEEAEDDASKHWSFQTPVRPQLPDLKNSQAPANPIDQFLLASMEQHGLTPRPLADKATLLRRVFLDLVGVPPTREELADFLNDPSPDAYPALVDRLLEDPRYGQRWGRHWLDVWRYSDWYGRRQVPDVWNSAPQIWRWRDWVVSSLNKDVGYDEMVRLMLAGDEILPEDDESVVATGYLIRNWYALNRNDWMRQNVEHAGKAFLGLTFNCAHCHDHKFDPILHTDYFQMRAWFEPIGIRQDRVPDQADPGLYQEYVYLQQRKIQRNGLVRIFDQQPEAATWFYTSGDERNRLTDRGSIPPGVPAFFSITPPKVEPISFSPPAFYPGLRPEIQQTIRADLERELSEAEDEKKNALQQLQESASDHQSQIAAARSTLDAAILTASKLQPIGALDGKQSLVLNASSGRRTLMNSLKSLASFPDGLTIEFRVRIIQDTHANFQLAQDLGGALTSAFVGFEQGNILSYSPGSTSTIQVGRYDMSKGQDQFRVVMKLDPAADDCELSVHSERDGIQLVNAAKIALNGWNPVEHPKMGILLDARAGSAVVFDAIRVLPPPDAEASGPLVAFEFEPPTYAEGKDVATLEGWSESDLSFAPGTSQVKEIISPDFEVQKAELALRNLELLEEARQQRIAAAEMKIEAKSLQLKSLDARIAADRAKYADPPLPYFPELAREASRMERQVALLTAQSDLLKSEVAQKLAIAKPEDDTDRKKELDTANGQVKAAQAAIDKATLDLSNEALNETYSALTPVYPATSTGRRRAFAEWLTQPDHPLTPRVAVNHIWARHFRSPLVASVFDFGRNGAVPTHPELLDWLAVEFVESGWSMKHLHRLMVTSDAYRRVTSAGQDAKANIELDPDNRYLWRMNSARMEAEVVRDSILACAGKLDLTLGGQELENSEALTTFRRSLYYTSHPEGDIGMSPLGILFDAPNATDCYRRTETVIPQQALALTNSDFVHSMSVEIVKQLPPLRSESGGLQLDKYIQASFEHILNRQPTDAERQVCRDAIAQQRKVLKSENVPDPDRRACEALIRSLLNHNDFITVR